MKKIILIFSLIGIVFCSYSQNEAKSKELTSPIMLNFLKNYQDKNTVQKVKVGEKLKREFGNIDNNTLIKPNLVEIMRMPVVNSDDKKYNTIRIINRDTNTLQPIK